MDGAFSGWLVSVKWSDDRVWSGGLCSWIVFSGKLGVE